MNSGHLLFSLILINIIFSKEKVCDYNSNNECHEKLKIDYSNLSLEQIITKNG